MSNHHYDKQYEDNSRTYPPDLVGVHPMGGGGLIEYPYRHYFELKHFRQIASPTKNMNFIELGSGNGRWIISIAPLVKHYTGIDSDPEGMSIARERIERLGITNTTLEELDITQFKGDRPYDLIYFSGVSEFLEDEYLHATLKNLSPWFTPRTIILDRSTLNHKKSSTDRINDGFYTYRTPQQLIEIFDKHGFDLKYHKRSYRPLRAGRFLSNSSLETTLRQIIEATKPASFYLMRTLSFLFDLIRPAENASKGVSHDFSLFLRKP